MSDEQIKNDYKATLRHVLTRVNRITGVPYNQDKAVLAWQFGNEMERASKGLDPKIQKAWQAEMAQYIKQLAPNQLLAYGQRFFPEEPDENVDIVIDHFYDSAKEWPARFTKGLQLTKGKRPFLIGEWGLSTDVAFIEKTHDAAIEMGAVGTMVWSLYFHRYEGGFWWHAIPTSDGTIFSYHWPGMPEGESINESGY